MISGRRLVALAESLTTPASSPGAEGEVFATLQIPGVPCHLLGRDAAGLFAVLISIDTSYPLGPLPPVRLENLSVTHAARCAVVRPGEAPGTGVFSVVRCLSKDPPLVELFIEVMASVSQQFPTPPAVGDAAQVLDRVIRLFRDLGRLSNRTIQGLWSELFVIARSTDPTIVANSWRSSVFDRCDFATADQRLEVKSTTGTVRAHAFSADQLRVPTDTTGVVASLFCQRSAGGVSVGDIWSTVRRRIASEPNLLLRVDGIVAETLGDAWRESLQLRYDWQTAKDSLRFFSMGSIPSVGSIPPELTEVRFRADLSRVEPLSATALIQHGGLLAAVAPEPK